MKALDVVSVFPQPIRKRNLPIAPGFGVAVLSLIAAWPIGVQAQSQPIFATFPNSPTDCGGTATTGCSFVEQAAVPGQRATIVTNVGRDGTTSVQLHTLRDDNTGFDPFGVERDDLVLVNADGTDKFFGEGTDQWWAHSILLPDDYVDPPESGRTTWNWGVLFDFHNSSLGAGQANFEINAWPTSAISSDRPTGLGFQIAYGNQNSPTVVQVAIDPNPDHPAQGAPAVRNVWYDFVYHVKWSSTDGFFAAWLRKSSDASTTYKRVLAYHGPTLYAGQQVYLKLANYHTSFGQASSVIHDRVAQAATWQDVIISGTSLEGQYEEDAAAFNVLANWQPYTSGEGSFSGGRMRATNVTNSTATFTFTGTEVTWMGGKCNTCGHATVSIDGGAPVDLDTGSINTEPNLFSEAVFNASGLAPGVTHTMVITVTGQNGTSSKEHYVIVDGFWVNPIATLGPN